MGGTTLKGGISPEEPFVWSSDPHENREISWNPSKEDPWSSHKEEDFWNDPWIMTCGKSGNAWPIVCLWMIWEKIP